MWEEWSHASTNLTQPNTTYCLWVSDLIIVRQVWPSPPKYYVSLISLGIISKSDLYLLKTWFIKASQNNTCEYALKVAWLTSII
jgi:hypothetical protein